MTDDERRLKYINDSGFLFQLRVEEEIRQTLADHRWSKIDHEVAWDDPQTGMDGFADLVIERDAMRLVLECKRVKNTEWVFLQPERRTGSTSDLVSAFWMDANPGDEYVAEWVLLRGNPVTQQSQFCVVPGQDKRSPLLEREMSTLVAAARGIAIRETELLRRRNRTRKVFYIPVLVTTATLATAQFDPGDAALSTGTIEASGVDLKEVEFLKFQKTLDTSEPLEWRDYDLTSAFRSNARTIFVVNADSVATFLQKLHLRSLPPGWPPA